MRNPFCDYCKENVASKEVPDAQGIEGEYGVYCSYKCRKKAED